MLRFASLVLLVVVGESMAQQRLDTSCPTTASATNFTMAKIADKPWYVSTLYYYLPSDGGRCVETTYYAYTNGSSGETVTMVSEKNNQTIRFKVSFEASTSDPADIIKTTEAFPVGDFSEKFMATDYETYLIVWGCQDLDDGSSVSLTWAMTTERSPSDEVLQKIAEEYAANNITTTPMLTMDQSNCS